MDDDKVKTGSPLKSNVIALLTIVAVIRLYDGARYDTMPTIDNAGLLTFGRQPRGDVPGVRLDARLADFVMRVRILSVGQTRFNTADGTQPVDDRGMGFVISTPLVVEVLEYYKPPPMERPPNRWVLQMIESGHNYGQEIKSIGATGVIFGTVREVGSGDLAIPESAEPLDQFAMELARTLSLRFKIEHRVGIMYNWYLIQNGIASSDYDDRTMATAGLVQQIADGVRP